MSSQLTPLEVPGTAPAVSSEALLLPATSGFAPATGPATSAVRAVPAATTRATPPPDERSPPHAREPDRPRAATGRRLATLPAAGTALSRRAREHLDVLSRLPWAMTRRACMDATIGGRPR